VDISEAERKRCERLSRMGDCYGKRRLFCVRDIRIDVVRNVGICEAKSLTSSFSFSACAEYVDFGGKVLSNQLKRLG